jgi:hypothetical protein
MKKFYKILYIVIFFNIAVGQNTDKTGLASGTQLLLPIGAESMARGNAAIASATGIEAMYYNPAGIIDVSEAGASYQQWIGDINIAYAGLTYSADTYAIGFSLKSLDVGDIQQTTRDDREGTSLGTYSPSLTIINISFALKFTDRITGGISAKSINESYFGVDGSALAFDAGIRYKFNNGLLLGITLKNLGSKNGF